jgi:LAS superfamily LD-carboxypeptidase LdcB
MLNELELTGRARTHVVQRDDLHAAILTDAIEPFLDMKADAARAGIDLAITSAFRDFAAQQRIWDMKFRGERPLYDAEGNARDHAALSAQEIVDAILCWSAVPGGSRHHWGSELDLVDRAAMPEDYRVRLVPEECAPGGVFHGLRCWLDANMVRYGFFRPYRTFRGGVLPEPWHLSYGPASVPALNALTPEVLARAVAASDMLGREIVLERLDDIHHRYVAGVDDPANEQRETFHGFPP